MKNGMRKLVCLVFVALLLTSMTVPVFAASATGSGTQGAYSYRWTVTCGDTTGTAQLELLTASSTVTVDVTNHLYDEVNDMLGTSSAHNVGYMTASATADNYITCILEGKTYYFVSNITKTEGLFSIAGLDVATGYAYPGS